uniref:Twisted gastrulation BMP signaling modulator 1a n=1 Tax=Eptatretus burgeri TaxID=7764 RepID=A0A8C4PZH2_EPTBU
TSPHQHHPSCHELCHCKPSSGNCTCCKQCMLCLSDLWIKCCDYSHPTAKSSVEDLTDPIPSLFRALTDGKYCTQLEHCHHILCYISFLAPCLNDPDPDLHQNLISSSLSHTPNMYTKFHPDLVVYFNDCMSINNCRMSCESMGASKYRWFHNAYCECIGPDCLNYGSLKPQCLNCLL